MADEDVELGGVQPLDRLVVDGEVEDGEEVAVVLVVVDLRPLALRDDVLDVERVPAEALGELLRRLDVGRDDVDPGEAASGELVDERRGRATTSRRAAGAAILRGCGAGSASVLRGSSIAYMVIRDCTREACPDQPRACPGSRPDAGSADGIRRDGARGACDRAAARGSSGSRASERRRRRDRGRPRRATRRSGRRIEPAADLGDRRPEREAEPPRERGERHVAPEERGSRGRRRAAPAAAVEALADREHRHHLGAGARRLRARERRPHDRHDDLSTPPRRAPAAPASRMRRSPRRAGRRSWASTTTRVSTRKIARADSLRGSLALDERVDCSDELRGRRSPTAI